MKEKIKIKGNMGVYLSENNVISFQLGDAPMNPFATSYVDPDAPVITNNNEQYSYLAIPGFNILKRGINNLECEEIAMDIKRNRLLPQLITKQQQLLYGKGLSLYTITVEGNKMVKHYQTIPEVSSWLDSWIGNGMAASAGACAQMIIKNYYYYKDFFVKWRKSRGAVIGYPPIAGLEVVDNCYCRLATTRKDVYSGGMVEYTDFSHIAYGDFAGIYGKYKIYRKFNLNNLDSFDYAAISHHRNRGISSIYGYNETFEGTRPFIRAANDTPEYINSFLRNCLAAKLHVIIPNAWCESKRRQITAICDENKKRAAAGESLLQYNHIDVGTAFKESTFVQYMQQELRQLTRYLSGKGNQGKAFTTISFRTGAGHDEERWRIEPVDMKFKDYISSLLEYDKRADEVLTSAVGMDASISAISKDGIISKSGSDALYNYNIYLMSLAIPDEICSEPFNWALKMNFPHIYNQGIRFGFYRDIAERTEDVQPDNRLNKQQS